MPHLGCPNDCVFCNQKRISGAQAPACPEDVTRILNEALEKIGEKGEREIQLAFFGGSFTAIKVSEQEALLGAAKKFSDAGKIDFLRLSTRPDAIDEETLERLKKYNVKIIELGAQSLDDNVLMLAGRGHTARDVIDASRLIKKSGFKLILQMMTGLPGDTGKQSMETAEKIIELKPDGVRIYPTVIVKDTALYDMWQAGLYKEHTVEDAVNICSKLLPMFDKAGIPVIRLGLNPTDDLSGGDAVGGAYHPALGELVRARIMRNRAEEIMLTKSDLSGKTAILCVNPLRISQMTGQKRENLKYLRDAFSLEKISVEADRAILENNIIIRYN